MPSAKKGKKKGSQIPAVDPLDSPAPPRRDDGGPPFDDRVPQPSSPPSGVHSPTGSRSSQDFKIDEAAKYMKDGDIIAYDIMVDEKKLKKVLKRLEEFDC